MTDDQAVATMERLKGGHSVGDTIVLRIWYLTRAWDYPVVLGPSNP